VELGDELLLLIGSHPAEHEEIEGLFGRSGEQGRRVGSDLDGEAVAEEGTAVEGRRGTWDDCKHGWQGVLRGGLLYVGDLVTTPPNNLFHVPQ
jgi:hypothetical protein